MRAGLLLLALALPAAAADERGIPPETWRSMVLGKTIVYHLGGSFYGLERYSASGDLVEFQHANGECLAGRWYMRDDLYCFDWEHEDRDECYRHLDEDGAISVIGDDENADPGIVFTVDSISDIPLQCGANMS